MKYYFILAAISFTFLGCEFSVKPYENKIKKQDSKIRNGIQVRSKGVKLEQAFLLNEDGTLLAEDNKIEIKKKIALHLVATGWTEKERKIYLEASQKVITDDGRVIIDKANLFKDDSLESIDAKDGRYLNLYFWLNEVTELFEYITIEFRVWDKIGEGEIKGSYKLYLK